MWVLRDKAWAEYYRCTFRVNNLTEPGDDVIQERDEALIKALEADANFYNALEFEQGLEP